MPLKLVHFFKLCIVKWPFNFIAGIMIHEFDTMLMQLLRHICKVAVYLTEII